MKKFIVSTKDQRTYRLPSEQVYKEVLSDYQKNGSVIIDGDLVAKHHFPTFSITGRDESEQEQLAAAVFPETKEKKDEQLWFREVLIASSKRISSGKKPLTFWHYKAARMIAKTWDIADTLAVLESDFESCDLDSPQLERKYFEDRVPEVQESSRYCGKCANGWLLNVKKKTARPCGCSEPVNEAYKEYVEKSAKAL